MEEATAVARVLRLQHRYQPEGPIANDPPSWHPAFMDLPDPIQAAFDAHPAPVRARLLDLRARILDIGAALPIGPIEESLKWGQPSYATPQTKAATPIRLGATKDGTPAIFTHCQSGVIGQVRAISPPGVTFDGTRALHLPLDSPPPDDIIDALIRTALTYRL